MKPSLLLVDSDSLLTLMLADLLKRRGFECRFASDGVEALRELGRAVPAVLILDRVLRRMSGDELARRVRANPRTRHVPFIVVSAVDPAEHAMTGFDVAPDDYLRKPCSVDLLVQRIEANLTALAA